MIRVVLLDGVSRQVIEPVSSLVAEDAVGQFGLLSCCEPFTTMAEPGLFRYRASPEGAWRFGASAGGLFQCGRSEGVTEVRWVSRRFLLGDDPAQLAQALSEAMAREHTIRVSARDTHAQLEMAWMRRMQAWMQGAT